MDRIQFIGAGAGSGKTTEVVKRIVEALANQTCTPAGLIATTYTVKAAEELRERIRRELLRQGHITLAEQLDQALVGTVHSVCARLLRRFAFEAGISPAVRVMAEEDGAALRAQAVDAVCSLAELCALQQLADRLGQTIRGGGHQWRGQLQQLLDEVRSNDFAPAELPRMGTAAAQEFLALFPRPTKDDLDGLLAHAIEQVIPALEQSGDTTDKTANYLEALQTTGQALAAGRLGWLDWLRLLKSGPAKKIVALADPVAAVLNRFGEHPRLHADIADYTARLFRLAQATLERFADLKRQQGVVDFADLEHLTLRLLRDNADVRAACQERWQLVVVDEFQDTSPMQLALFLEWAQLAPRSIWVGDPKQAIYGFRNTDPQLTDAVVGALRTAGAAREILGRSHRSVSDLVKLVNGLFAGPFARTLHLREEEVTLMATRGPKVGPAPAVEFFDIRSGEALKKGGERKPTLDEIAGCVAEGIRALLQPAAGVTVFDKELKRERPIAPGDIAVLCRKNDHGQRLAAALTAAGFTVSQGGAGLLGTPEARLGLACLRRLADAEDSLAAAELIALGSAAAPKDWLADRLGYLAAHPTGADRWRLEGPDADPRLVRLETACAQAAWLTPAEALDLALEAGDAFATVTAWGPSAARAAQRRANLEALRGLAARYTDRCTSAGVPATVAGLLQWCAAAQIAKTDAKAGDPSPGAIQVLTYHRAKGLEWPVVLCTNLTEPERTDLFNVQSLADAGQPFDMRAPLANRRLRFWASPFGELETGVPLLDELGQCDAARQQAARARAEALRLLYVGFTRARDRLVLVRVPGQPLEWLDVLDAPALNLATNQIELPSGEQVVCAQRVLQPVAMAAPTAAAQVRWLATATGRTDKLPAILSPSHAAPLANFQAPVCETYGPRLPLVGKVDEAALGDALHAIFAAELLNPGQSDRSARVRAELAAFGLTGSVDVVQVVALLERFHAEVQRRFAPRRMLVETPFHYRNAAGQRVSGVMDLSLETAQGWVLVDHKSFPGGPDKWSAKALTFSGQLALYAQTLREQGKTACEIWVHFPVGGGWVRLEAQ